MTVIDLSVAVGMSRRVWAIVLFRLSFVHSQGQAKQCIIEPVKVGRSPNWLGVWHIIIHKSEMRWIISWTFYRRSTLWSTKLFRHGWSAAGCSSLVEG